MNRIIIFFACVLMALNSFAQFGNVTPLNRPIQGEIYDLYDIDNDGDMDVVSYENHGGGIKSRLVWLENVGGRFPKHSNLIVDSMGWINELKVADLDNDNDADILIYSNNNNELHWGENDGFGLYTFHFINSTTSVVKKIETIDIDNDNDLDIIINIGGSSIFSIENLSPGSFGIKNLIGSGDENFKFRDVDNDNNFDIICAQNNIGYYKSNGNGTFQSFQSFLNPSSNSYGVDMIDVDGDLDLDLLEITSTDSIRIYENVGGNYTNMITVDDNIFTFSDARFIDVDNDLDFDIVSTNTGSHEVFYHENLGGSFAPRSSLINISSPENISIVDIDLDNDLDVVYASKAGGNRLHVRINNNGLLLNEYIIGSMMFQTDKIQIIDIDNDSDMDIVTTRPSVSGYFPHIAWHENTGTGNYSIPKSIDSVYNLKTSIFADLDGDGLPDLLKSYFNFTPSTYYRLSWRKNLGNGNFGSTVILNNITSGHAYDEIAVADLDGDNDLDIIAYRNGNALHLYENLGVGIFGAQQVIAPTGFEECEFKDIDGDLDLDIVTSYYPIGAAWYENLGSLTFNPRAVLFQSTSNIVSNNIEVDDIDNDGDYDIISIGHHPSNFSMAELWVGLNDGTGNFSATMIDNTISGNNDVNLTDINGDGLKDLAIVSLNPSRIGWKENQGNGSFGSFNMILGSNSSLPATYRSYNRIVSADLDNDGDQDLVCGADNINLHTLMLENFYTGSYQYNGTIFYDLNQNGLIDGADYGLNSVPVTISPNPITGFTNHNGYYFFATDTGASIISHSLSANWLLTTDSVTYTRTLTGATPVISNLNFGYFPAILQTELESDLTGGFPRCNTDINYWINYKNIGTTEPNGKIHLTLAPNINYISASVTPDSIIGQNIYWYYDSLNFFASGSIQLKVNMPSVSFIGDTLTSYLTVHEIDAFGNSIYQVIDTLDQILVCAYDPNDKSVSPVGYYDEHFISNNQQLEYLIRFQNTGNDTAITVMLRDRLDTNLLWNSINIISSSDSLIHWLEPDGEMVFKFTNIMLPDSGSDFLGSQGFVKFRITPKPGLDPLTRIYNKCDIYFDLNPPILTNYVFNTIECNSVPNPNISFVNPYLSSGVSGNYTYEWYYNDTLIFGAVNDTLTPIHAGEYYVIISDSLGCYRISEIFNYVPTSMNELVYKHNSIKVYPNPFQDFTTIEISDDLLGYDLMVLDLLGRRVYEVKNIKSNRIVIKSSDLFKGVFIPILNNTSTNENIYFGKIIVK